jgi:hypothetical protein
VREPDFWDDLVSRLRDGRSGVRFPARDVGFPLLYRTAYSVRPGGLFPCSEVPGEGRIPEPTLTIKAFHHITFLEGTDREENYTDLGPIHTLRRVSVVTLPSERSVFTLSAMFSHIPEQHVIGGL